MARIAVNGQSVKAPIAPHQLPAKTFKFPVPGRKGKTIWAKMQPLQMEPRTPPVSPEEKASRRAAARVAKAKADERRERRLFVAEACKFQDRLPSGFRKKLSDVRAKHARDMKAEEAEVEKKIAQEAGYMKRLYLQTMSER